MEKTKNVLCVTLEITIDKSHKYVTSSGSVCVCVCHIQKTAEYDIIWVVWLCSDELRGPSQTKLFFCFVNNSENVVCAICQFPKSTCNGALNNSSSMFEMYIVILSKWCGLHTLLYGNGRIFVS